MDENHRSDARARRLIPRKFTLFIRTSLYPCRTPPSLALCGLPAELVASTNIDINEGTMIASRKRSGQLVAVLPPIITSRTTMARRATKTKAGQIELTIRQGEVLDAIRAFIKINGVSPRERRSRRGSA